MSDITKASWTKAAEKALVGRTIKAVRYLSDEEQNELGWYGKSLVLILDNDECLYASQDDEGNGPGALFTTFEKLPVIPVFS